MNFKKFTTVLTVVASLALVLGACGNDDSSETNSTNSDDNQTNTSGDSEETVSALVAGGEMKDGTYSLVEKTFDDNGWKVSIEMIVEDGKITTTNYNYKDAEGNLKSEDEAYQENMVEKSGVGPKEFIPQLSNALVEKQDAQKMDIVTGATHSSDSFINYAQQLIQAAQKGDETTIEIDNKAALVDGEYALAENNIGSTGWKVYINMTVKDGKISTVDYNYLNENDELKTDDEEYQKTMTEQSGIGPQDFVPALSDALVETQDPAAVEVVTGATHSSHSFKLYAAQLINAAQKGETEKIEVDNFVYDESH